MSETVVESDGLGDPVSAQADEATEGGIVAGVNAMPVTSDTIEPNTFNIKPSLQDKFKTSYVKDIIHDILTEELNGKTYSPDDAKQWTTNIANTINRRVREMKWKRYKHIVQVFIGEQRGAGVKSGVKCVWDSETDNYASDVYLGVSGIGRFVLRYVFSMSVLLQETLFCVAAVFAVYFY